MSEQNVSPAKQHVEMSRHDLEELTKKRKQVFANIVEQLKPWLFEFGNWIFGGLIAFNLVIVAPLLTISLGHRAVLVSITLFVCALPLNVVGLFVLKLTRDMNDMAINNVMRDAMKQAFEETDVAQIDELLREPMENESLSKRRTDIGLRYSMYLAALSTVLTLLGMAAALWYIAWWVAVIFGVMVILSLIIAFTTAGRLMRPDAEAEKKLRSRRRDPNARQ